MSHDAAAAAAKPLAGIRVLDFTRVLAGPYCTALMADLGAEVIKVESAHGDDYRHIGPFDQGESLLFQTLNRGKRSITLNLKSDEDIATIKALLADTDVLVENFRPGVMEKLGLGPEVCLACNEKLVFGRMTGWGQEGPWASMAGHDINYISLTGALYSTGRKDQKPVPPLNLVGDMGGGGMLLVNGVLAALLETTNSGSGQVIDVAMVDGAAQLMWMFHGFEAMGLWDASQREANMLDGAAHFYDTYECADGEYVSIGSIEPQFDALLKALAG